MTALVVRPNTPEWLEERKKYIGASDAPAVLGLTPNWRTARDVAQEKMGRSEEVKADNKILNRGRVLEPLVKRMYIEETGNEIFSAPMYRHKVYDWMSATPDGWSVGNDTEALLECKTVSSFCKHEWVDVWNDEQEYDVVPTKYWVQVQHQMAVTGEKKVIVAAIFASEDLFEILVNMVEAGTDMKSVYNLARDVVEFKTIEVERDCEFIEKLIGIEREFWENLQQGVMPEDYKYVRDSGAIRVASAEEEKLLEEFRGAYQQKSIAEDEFERISHKVKEAIGVDSGLYSEFLGKVTYRQGRGRKRTDWKNMAKDLIEKNLSPAEQEKIVARYSCKSEAMRRLAYPYKYWKMN